MESTTGLGAGAACPVRRGTRKQSARPGHRGSLGQRGGGGRSFAGLTAGRGGLLTQGTGSDRVHGWLLPVKRLLSAILVF